MFLAPREIALLVQHLTRPSGPASPRPQSLGSGPPRLSTAPGDRELEQLIQRLELTHQSLHEQSSAQSLVATPSLNATPDLVRVLVTYFISTYVHSYIEWLTAFQLDGLAPSFPGCK